MKELAAKGFGWIVNTIRDIRDILLWFIRDHNGKPSNTRLVILIITYKAIEWGNHIVYHTNDISYNLLLLLVICILGVAFFMRMLTQKNFVDSITSIITKNTPRVSSSTRTTPTSQGWWSGGINPPTAEEIDDALEGPGANLNERRSDIT